MLILELGPHGIKIPWGKTGLLGHLVMHVGSERDTRSLPHTTNRNQAQLD
jgi:hypothetical protein